MTLLTSADLDSPTAYLHDRPVLSRRSAALIAAIAVCLSAASGWFIAGSEGVARFERTTLDTRFRFRGSRPHRTRIIIVEIDETDRRALKEGDQAFNIRRHLSQAINHLADAGAIVIGLDMWLEDRSTPDVDLALADAISNANVVLATVYAEGRVIRAADIFRAAEPAEGVITVMPDAGDNVLRRLPPRLYLDVLATPDASAGIRIPHFPISVALFAALERDETAQVRFEGDVATIGSHSIRAGELVDYRCVKRGMTPDAYPFPVVSFHDAVSGRLDAGQINGAIVLIGEARMLQDSFVTPLSVEPTPGVHYHANVIAQILEDRHFKEVDSQRRAGRMTTAGLTAISAALAWFPLAWRRRRGRRDAMRAIVSVMACAMLLVGYSVGVFWAFERDVVLMLVAPLLAMGAAMASGFIARWIVAGLRNRRLEERTRQIERLFSQSVSERMLEAIKAHPEKVGRTEVRDVSVLFCDLRDYTRQTEEQGPRQTADMLNEYFTYMTVAVFENDGFLDKFVGDALMAVFSAPFEQSDHAERAVRTALSMRRRLAALNAIRISRGQSALRCGFGIHSGPAALGHIGTRNRANYTVIGTTVNLASRVEHYSRDGEVLLTEAACEHIKKSGFTIREFGEFELRGVHGLRRLYSVESPAD